MCIRDRERQEIRARLKLQPEQDLFFSSISYSNSIFGKNKVLPLKDLQKRHFTLVTGIANPKPLVEFLKQTSSDFEYIAFPDHHNFSASEIKALRSKELILTTEKDYMRLKNEIPEEKIFYLPIATRILESEEEFERRVLSFAQKK